MFFFSSRRRHTRFSRDWSSDVCSSDLAAFHYFVSQTGKFENLKFKLMAYENELKMGDDKLLKFCLHQSKPIVKHKNKIICLFDKIGRASCRERVEIEMLERLLKDSKGK